MNGPTIMYGPGISAARMPTPDQVERVLVDYAKTVESEQLARIERTLAALVERVAALERKSKRGRRRR